MTTRSTRQRSFVKRISGFLLIFPLCALPALAQDPVVDSADPPSAEQETYDLEVEIAGDNFGKDSEVDFFVSCELNDPSCTPNDPGGIHVKKVKVLGPKKLKATIDVAPDAAVDEFDIQVMSRGRTGKGIELFRVFEKTHPTQDTTPPGEVTISVVDSSYSSITLSWTAPADDGHDPASGPAERYHVWCKLGNVLIDDSGWGDCGCPWPGDPGSQELCVVGWHERDISGGGLLPESTYSFAVKTQDDADNVSAPSNRVVANTEPFVGDPSCRIQEVPMPSDGTLGHGFNLAGDPVIAGVFEDRFRIATGSWDQGSQAWAWTLEDVPGQINGNSFAMDPFGVPAFGASTSPKGNKLEVVYTFHDGSQWVHEAVESPRATYLSGVQLAFDPSGNPALTYTLRLSRSEEGQLRLARKDEAGTWSIEIVDPASGLTRPTLTFDGTGNPVITYPFDETENPPTEIVKVATRTGQSWQLETLSFPRPEGFGVAGLHLIWEPLRGDFVGVHDQCYDIWYCEGQSDSWDCHSAFYGTPGSPYGSQFIASDSFGDVLLAYEAHTEDVNLAHSPDGVTWTHEAVDYAWVHFQDGSVSSSGPHLALDHSGSPTLSWMWNQEIDLVPVDRRTYFAWKVATP